MTYSSYLPRMLTPALAALAVSVMGATAQTPMPAQDFVERTAVVSMFGVEAATLALHKSNSSEIKAFAHRLTDQHAVATSSLRRIVATRSDIALPDRPDGRHLAVLSALSDKQGEDFDKAYVETQRTAYREAASLMERYAGGGEDAELKGFAAKSLAVFQDLNRKAQQLPAAP